MGPEATLRTKNEDDTTKKKKLLQIGGLMSPDNNASKGGSTLSPGVRVRAVKNVVTLVPGTQSGRFKVVSTRDSSVSQVETRGVCLLLNLEPKSDAYGRAVDFRTSGGSRLVLSPNGI